VLLQKLVIIFLLSWVVKFCVIQVVGRVNCLCSSTFLNSLIRLGENTLKVMIYQHFQPYSEQVVVIEKLMISTDNLSCMPGQFSQSSE
jgi:hypothetical protein